MINKYTIFTRQGKYNADNYAALLEELWQLAYALGNIDSVRITKGKKTLSLGAVKKILHNVSG